MEPDNLKLDFVNYCVAHDYKYDCGYDWCDCVDYGAYVNVLIRGKWHTLYCLDNGGYRFDKTLVNSIDEIERLIENGL